MAKENIDRQLQEMALTQWEDFKKLLGIDPTNFIICKERKGGKSYNQIAIATKTHREKVRRVCKVCP